jgi:hypothetical protein
MLSIARNISPCCAAREGLARKAPPARDPLSFKEIAVTAESDLDRLRRKAEALIENDIERLRAQGAKVAICLAFYTPQGWAELQAVPEANVRRIPYRAFAANWKILADAFAARGLTVVRVPVDVAEMLHWCAQHGLDPDSHGRDAYGSALLVAHDSGRSVMSVPPPGRRMH